MSSPSSGGGNNNSVGIREGTRVILREITANLQNSPPGQSSRRKSGNDAASVKGDQQQQQQQHQQQPQHDVKVRFIREFADVGVVREANTESSLSSASSFQSLTSTLSSKCSSGICPDSSPAKACDASYLSPDIPGLDDLISACENIRLTDETLDISKDQSFTVQPDGEDLSGDQTFTSAIDRNSPNLTVDNDVGSPVKFSPNATQNLDVTRNIDEDKDVSATNAFYECANALIDEAAEFTRTNTEVESISDNFVQCVSNLDKIESSKIDEKETKNHEKSIDLEQIETPKIDEIEIKNHEKFIDLERIERSKIDEIKNHDEDHEKFIDHEQIEDSKIDEIKNHDEDHEKSIDPEQIEDSKIDEIKNYDEDREKSDDNRENANNLVENENEDDSIVDKIRNIDDQTSSILREQANLNVTFESPTDFVVENVDRETNEIVKICDKEIVEESEKESIFNVTVDVPYDLKDTERIEGLNYDEKETIPVESLPDLIVEDNSKLQNVELSEALTPFPSQNNEISSCPSLPTLSSICLRATLNEIDPIATEISNQNVSIHEKIITAIETALPVKIVETTNPNVSNHEETISTVETPSLSDKFAVIAAKDVSPNNSISTIKEPTFFDAQKFVEDSIEFPENSSPEKIVNERTNVRRIDEVPDFDRRNVDKIEKFIEPKQIDFSNFKKPKTPAGKSTIAEVLPNSSRRNDDERKIHPIDKTEVDDRIDSEIVDNHEANVSTESEKLDDTVTIQDISAENIFSIPESDQYEQFRPKQQSTSLTIVKTSIRDSNESATVVRSGAKLLSDVNKVTKPIEVVPDEYSAFLPQQQSTTLNNFPNRPFAKLERQPTPFVVVPSTNDDKRFNGDNETCHVEPDTTIDDRCNFDKLEIAARAVAKDIYNTSRQLEEENTENFVTASSEFFDPESFDFLLSKSPRQNARRDLRAESLYVKFDPLVSNTSMLPQGNIQNTSGPVNDKTNGDNNTTITNIGTPKRNPAIAAIDRLLFYSPMTTATTPTTDTATIQKTNVPQEKTEPTEETSAETVNMAKELELVRSTVIQLEEQVEKLKIENEEALEKQSSYQEKINQLQTQLAQEIKNKNQITVVVDEYEKSISRLVAERERDRKNLDLEKAKLQEELAAARHHLDNTESAFNDVHLKYERLKAVVTTYKNNEAALKQSVQENVEIIKSLENRYDQVKEHATARLEKANQDLEAIRKQHESETVRLHAMLRKADLKSNSLAELVEQKTKENKELTQILDEVIARVGRNKSE